MKWVPTREEWAEIYAEHVAGLDALMKEHGFSGIFPDGEGRFPSRRRCSPEHDPLKDVEDAPPPVNFYGQPLEGGFASDEIEPRGVDVDLLRLHLGIPSPWEIMPRVTLPHQRRARGLAEER